MIAAVRSGMSWWDRFVFEGCDPRMVPVLRIGYALMLLIQVNMAWEDVDLWYCNDGVLSSAAAMEVGGPSRWSLLFVLPSTPTVVRVCQAILVGHAVLMLLGVWSRVQAAAIFVWLVSFQNRNPFVNDGEDTVFRLFAFILIFLPLDAAWSIWKRREGQPSTLQESATPPRAAWALRLMQFEMTAIYASAGISKVFGETWQNGTALWYVSRMTDNYGRWIPPTLFDHATFTAAATWGTLALELLLPIALWVRPLRKIAILAAFALHLGIEVSMNLFMFEWIMMLGLLSFVDVEEWRTGWPFRFRTRTAL